MSSRKKRRRPPPNRPGTPEPQPSDEPIPDAPRGPGRARTSRARTLGFVTAVVLLVSAFLLQTFSTLDTTAPTFDEVAHLPAGYAELVTGTVLFNQEHPPLAKLIAAAALWPKGGDLDDLAPNWRSLDEWRFGQTFLFRPGRDPTALMTRARRGPIMIGLLLCIACLVWSFRLFGPAGGLFTLTLCVFSPTLLAHTRLVATDVPVAAFGILTAFATWELMNRPTVRRSLGAGLALGATLASKFSGVLFIPSLGLSVAHLWWRHARGKSKQSALTGLTTRRVALLTVLVLGTAAVVIALSYGWPPSLRGYWDGFSNVRDHANPGYESFLLGKFRTTRFPLYFPAAFLLKTSPAVLLSLILLAGLPLLRRLRVAVPVRASGVDARLLLLLPPLLYTAFIMATAWDIGIRYLIPVYPFVFVALGLLGASLWPRPMGKAVVIALVALHVRAAVVAWPDPISYFNGLFGCRGPAAVHCLRDSNLDWGQDLGRAAEAVDRLRQPGEQVVLLYPGSADARAYLNNWRPMRDDELVHPRPQLYVVSSAQLNLVLYNAGLSDTDENWFRRFQPAVTVGNTFLIYDFRPSGR